jgi:hypothetical protein
MTNKLIFRKVIDWSCLNWGFTIPLESHQNFHDYNDKYIPRGRHEEVTIVFKNKRFKGILRNVNRKVKSDTLQLLYSADSEFIKLLRKEFRITYEYVLRERALALKEGSKRPYIKIPKKIREYIEVYGPGKAFEFDVKLVSQKEEVMPGKTNNLKKEMRILESDKANFPFLPDLFSELVDISFGKADDRKYKNRGIETLFEDLVFFAFCILGYDEARQLGYKKSGGKKGYPDGELKSHNSDYLVIYDAKVRANEYKINVPDRRALEDYVRTARVKNFKKIYCVIISSKFGDYPRPISGCALTYLTTKKLMQLLSLKIQNPQYVNPLSLEILFSQGSLVEDDDLKSWIDEHELAAFDLNEILKKPSLDSFF